MYYCPCAYFVVIVNFALQMILLIAPVTIMSSSTCIVLAVQINALKWLDPTRSKWCMLEGVIDEDSSLQLGIKKKKTTTLWISVQRSKASPQAMKLVQEIQISSKRRLDGWNVVEDDTCRTQVTITSSLGISRNRKGTIRLEAMDLERKEEETEIHTNGTSNLLIGKAIPLLADKSHRFTLFADWLAATFPSTTLHQILDVAGGKGLLGKALCERHPNLDMKVTVLDPEPRIQGNPSRTAPVNVIAEPLQGDGSDLLHHSDKRIQKLLRQTTLLVGLHPDQATEAMLEFALRLSVPVAIVPCCVMPKLFPDRKQLKSGDPVRSYSSFCEYLKHKAVQLGLPELQVTHLPFCGRSTVLYSLPRIATT